MTTVNLDGPRGTTEKFLILDVNEVDKGFDEKLSLLNSLKVLARTAHSHRNLNSLDVQQADGNLTHIRLLFPHPQRESEQDVDL